VLLDTAQRLQQQKDARHMEANAGVSTRFEVGSYVLISYNPKNECVNKIASAVKGTLSCG